MKRFRPPIIEVPDETAPVVAQKTEAEVRAIFAQMRNHLEGLTSDEVESLPSVPSVPSVVPTLLSGSKQP